ncbi:pimeloyl-ACP methyl ester esterase BioH [Thalassotalea marina]|uniref:Pimeloyl-[acyl-carrier protein] methyl ester esterase n=1 Tax=Thalassotalea marina TaxID=1673741 RepID=A0A919BMD6_9GAMM|nr:pimeloyl-ACP methyl ester esterase BioH [Thalassotalea marina]GHF99650.1 pimeloyl-[acyl-carrier protein] methyl ester esterase [Thalassotalea marina]
MANNLKVTRFGQGIPLVLIHGWGLNAGVWQPLAKKLASDFEVITIDLPGYGLNIDNVPTSYELVSITEQIKLAVGKPAVYLGWSLGGLVATELAKQYKNDVMALVTVASSPYFVAGEDWPGIEPNVLAMFHRQLESDTKKTIENFLKIQAMGSPHIRDDIRTIRDLIMQFDMPTKRTLEESLLLLETVDHRASLSDISCPFLRIYGRLDGLVPKAVLNKIDDLAPTSDSIVLDKASHAPFISHVDEFEQALVNWLQQCKLMA